MPFAEFIATCIVILILYRPLFWCTRWVILRALKANKDLDKEAIQIGNVVHGDQAGGDINKPEEKPKGKAKAKK